MRSTSGYAFSLGSGVFSWCTKKQQTVAQSSAEAEYVAASLATQQAIWLKRIMEDVGEKQKEAVVINCDNKSAIAMAKNPVYHSRTKYEEQVADIFTKALPRAKFQQLRKALGVMEQHIKGENVD